MTGASNEALKEGVKSGVEIPLGLTWVTHSRPVPAHFQRPLPPGP
ncbi:uncharacterized protein METZ01_LOCUS140153 [marine metagenome]|uniref:Uncharacterized protein n=1 Tax=marine metagenome TaxID=408172 RepID=A0A381ZDL5_9ZZZZ